MTIQRIVADQLSQGCHNSILRFWQ